jgi:hypothetical protein
MRTTILIAALLIATPAGAIVHKRGEPPTMQAIVNQVEQSESDVSSLRYQIESLEHEVHSLEDTVGDLRRNAR